MPILSSRSFSTSLGLGLFLVSVTATAQTAPAPAPMPNAALPSQQMKPQFEGRSLYTYVEQMPVYSDGGKEGLQTYISSHVRGSAKGREAYVTFIIDQTGKARRPALGPNPAETDAAVDPALATAFSDIKPFNPGHQNGKPADVKLTLPIAKPVKK